MMLRLRLMLATLDACHAAITPLRRRAAATLRDDIFADAYYFHAGDAHVSPLR